MTINNRIQTLRKLMQKQQLDAWLIPSGDPHQSEYVAEHWKGRQWISGFSGSAGTAVVTAEHAGIWTDSRYFLQAEQELANSEFVLHKLSANPDSGFSFWLSQNLPKGSTVGCDGNLFSTSAIHALQKTLNENGISLSTHADITGAIWTDRPELPISPVFQHPVSLAGLTREEKWKAIRKEMEKTGATMHLIPALDDVAWTLNIRGNDVECNPVTIAFAIIDKLNAHLFIDIAKIDNSLQQVLLNEGVIIHAYEDLHAFLANTNEHDKILIDPDITNFNLFSAIPEKSILKGQSIPLKLKAIKNNAEIDGIKQAMVKDGIALTEFFVWLKEELAQRELTEYEAGEKLAFFRKRRGNYHGESFSPIVGYKGNGAIVHYRAPKNGSAIIKNEGVLLIDSGGQYTEGTTDITRTIGLGNNTAEEKLHYTLVLKGNIALTLAVFPENTLGIQLDTLARQYLWKANLDYGHGTGHGVGAFLNVHEPPQGFAPNLSMRGVTGLKAGMFTSNEPGYYKTNEHGIRIENLVLAIPANNNPNFLQFQVLTLFPIDKSLINFDLLSREELKWLNDYHREVFNTLHEHLDDKHKNWLQDMCTPISIHS